MKYNFSFNYDGRGRGRRSEMIDCANDQEALQEMRAVVKGSLQHMSVSAQLSAGLAVVQGAGSSVSETVRGMS
jgi:hypothetical protein